MLQNCFRNLFGSSLKGSWNKRRGKEMFGELRDVCVLNWVKFDCVKKNEEI